MNNKRLGLTRLAVLQANMPCVRPIVLLAVFLAMVQPQGLAQEFFYRFTAIADTEQGAPPYAVIAGVPCQNNNDYATFEANQIVNNNASTSIDGVFSRIGLGDTASIADTAQQQYKNFDFGMDCSINAKGVAIFTAGHQETTLLLLGGGGIPVQTLLSNNGTYGVDGFQLNNQNTAVVLEERLDGSGDVVLTKAPGGSEKTIATTFSNSPYMTIGSVSINNAGTVAFAATLRDGSGGGIFTLPESGITQVLTGSSGPAAYFVNIDMNDKGSVAFDGSTLDGTPGVWRIDSGGGGYPPVVTEIANGNTVGAGEFTGISINSSGEVAYGFFDGEMYEVGLGNGGRFFGFLGPGPIVIRPYSMILGRMVGSGFIGQDSLNDLGQLVLRLVFLDGSEMIARAEVVNNLLPPLNPVAEFALSTGTGSRAGVHIPVNLPPRLLELAFDATFMTGQGELKVMLGDKPLKSVAASSRGARQSIRIPIDLRPKGRSKVPAVPQQLKFEFTGTQGMVAQIGNIHIPGTDLNWSPRRKNSRWRFDTQGGGWASLVDATRFPVEIKVLSPEPREASTPAHTVSVAILSTKSFDATKDIERETLHFAGMSARSERDAKGRELPQCAARDVNGDQYPDLVCEFEAPETAASGAAQKWSRRLEGMTPYGWSVEGRAD
jgi:hypothetical protein